MEIPLFPLHVVLVPGAPLPLHVFEPRYRALLADCLASRTPFGVVCLSAGREAGATSVSFAAVGTLAEIREVARYPDGRADLVTIGTRRFRLAEVDADRKPYLVGIGELLDEPLGDPDRVARLAARVRRRFLAYLELLQPDGDAADDEDEAADDEAAPGSADAPDDRPADVDAPGVARSPGPGARARLEAIVDRLAPRDDPTLLGHVVAGLLQVELPRRQRLLEAASTEERLADLVGLLDRETRLLARRLGPFDPDPRLFALRRN
jgi:Lon protease-like protein